MKLSKNFSLKEMTTSQTAERKGINNNPNDDQITGLQKLCENILQPVRDHYATPVTISSGFRSEELCVAIGSIYKLTARQGPSCRLRDIWHAQC